MKRFFNVLLICVGVFIMASISCSSGPEDIVEEKSMEFEGQIIEANHPLIQYTGRIDFSKPEAPTFSYPGTHIRARFTGTQIAVIMDDSSQSDYFAVKIDGEEYPFFQTMDYSFTFYIANDLSAGEHQIDLIKRTESNCGTASFKGFMIENGAELLEVESAPLKRIEFVGDSITCGYGNLVSTNSPNDFHFTPINEDNTQAWGAIASEKLKAEYISTSYSGRGMYSNLDGNKDFTMPKVYHSVFPDKLDKAQWDAAAWNPDMIVINLGTNDYSWEGFQEGLEFETFDSAYIDAYRTFIADLRETHGAEVQIVCVIGPMMGDSYPPGRKSLSRIRAAVSGIVEDLNQSGDDAIFFLELPAQQPPYGEDWHPTAATHLKMGNTLADFVVKNLPGWN